MRTGRPLTKRTGGRRERTGKKRSSLGEKSNRPDLVLRDGHAPAAPRAIGDLRNHGQSTQLQQ